MEVTSAQISTGASVGGAPRSTIQAPPIDEAARQRVADLAENRRALSAEGVQRSEVNDDRTAEALAATREAIARAVGANTRLSISRSPESLTFVYRAIDVTSGEVVNEWPEQAFVDLIRNVRSDIAFDPEKGLMLDETA